MLTSLTLTKALLERGIADDRLEKSAQCVTEHSARHSLVLTERTFHLMLLILLQVGQESQSVEDDLTKLAVTIHVLQPSLVVALASKL